MTRHDDKVRLKHMPDRAQEALLMVKGKQRQDLEQDRMLELALVRLIEIIGEAAVRVSPDGQSKYSSVPWPQIIGMRNRLVHGYDQVDLDVLWNTIEFDLPPLVKELENIQTLEGGELFD
jgi:uncharacterized protein with HEPN domain